MVKFSHTPPAAPSLKFDYANKTVGATYFAVLLSDEFASPSAEVR